MLGHSDISSVTFKLSGDEDHARESYAEILTHELHNTDGRCTANGPNEPRLGTMDNGVRCSSCGQGKNLCLGHSGHLNLRVAVLQTIAIPEVRKWLRVTCLVCGTCMVDREKYINIAPSKRLTVAATIDVAGKPCPNPACQSIHPKIVKCSEDYFTFWADAPGAVDKKRTGPVIHGTQLFPDMIRSILGKITDDTVFGLGQTANSHPRKLTLRIIAIPPNTIRPNVRSFGGSGSSNHDSTNLIQHIVKRNNQLPEQLPDGVTTYRYPPIPVDGDFVRSHQNLQQLYFDLNMGGGTTNATQGNNGRRGLVVGARPISSFLRHLPSKTGRIRMNLLGRRVFSICRTTICGNVRLKIDEVAIPLAYAKTMQVAETVQAHNKDWLMSFFLNGRTQYPGSSHIIRKSTGDMHEISGLRNTRIEIGDIIYRDVIDGDLAYFTRQPTLIRSSLGVHKIIVIRDPGVFTIQMNIAACSWYNADFDGDQMNLWVIRNPASQAEARLMSAVSNWFTSTDTQSPIGLTQDSTIGSHKLTQSTVRINRYYLMNLFAGADLPMVVFPKTPDRGYFTGRDVISLMLKQTPINYSSVPTGYNPVYHPFIQFDKDEMRTVIEQGVMLKGVLDNASIGEGARASIFNLVNREYGTEKAMNIVYALQQISLQFLIYKGATVGTGDLIPSIGATKQINELMSSVRLESQVITDQLIRGEIMPPIGSTVREFYEELQINALNMPENEIFQIILGEILPNSNGFFHMVATGSKGKNPNLIHVIGAIGQTLINGKRIQENFAFRRTSPYSPRFSTEPSAFGFVESSFISGMNVEECIYRSMHGRFDLITKALSTAITGYFMRKGAMNAQSMVIDNYRRVVKDNKIVHMIYGGSGVDTRYQEVVRFNTVMCSDSDLQKLVAVDLAALGCSGDVKTAQDVADAQVNAIVADRDLYRTIFLNIEQSNFNHGFEPSVRVPVNVKRIVDDVLIAARGEQHPLTAAGITRRIEFVNDLCLRIPYILTNDIQERIRAKLPVHLIAASMLICMFIRSELSPAILVKLTDDQLTFISDTLRQRYSRSLIDYGSAPGILATQSISAPLVQFMLDSHHRSVAGKGNSGMSRVQEIYGAKNMGAESSSTMMLTLLEDNDVIAQRVANSIEILDFKRFIARYDTLLEPYDALLCPEFVDDQDWISRFEQSHPLISAPGDLMNWCYRIVLDKSSMALKNISLEIIVRKLRALNSGIYVVHTPEAVPEIIIRIWNRSSQFKKDVDHEGRASVILNDILDTTIRGISGVIRADVDTTSRTIVDESGALVNINKTVIVTSGTNLYGVLMHPMIDSNRVISSSIGDTNRIFGIEAARTKIISETQAFTESDPTHLHIYADEMTRTGVYTSFERGGLNVREHNNILLRMAFASPIKIATEAALANSYNPIYGLAGPQMVGTIPRVGSLYNEVVINCDFVTEKYTSSSGMLDEFMS